MSFELPPVVKLAERLLLDVEQAVSRFPRRHRYVFGQDLRARAFETAKLAHRAWRDRAQQEHWVSQLVWSVDEIKLSLQLGTRLKAFSSFGQFEALARTATDLGRQVGGWHRQQQIHPKGQNSQPRVAAERAQILSTRGASHGATR